MRFLIIPKLVRSVIRFHFWIEMLKEIAVTKQKQVKKQNIKHFQKQQHYYKSAEKLPECESIHYTVPAAVNHCPIIIIRDRIIKSHPIA